jgi:hypothetical protein
VLRQLAEHYKGNTAQGRNLLIKNVAVHMTKQVLKQDCVRLQELNAQNTHLTIEALEETLLYECMIPGLEKPVVFKGIADRIDRERNLIYILDYKTGFLKKAEMGCNSIDLLFEPTKKNKAFQVMFYAWLYHKKHGMPDGGLQAGLFSTRSPSEGFLRLKVGKTIDISVDDLQLFEEQLFELIKELFEATKSFTPRFITLDDTD